MKTGWESKSVFLWSLIFGLTFFRLLFVPTMGLMPQGAYYFFYSEHPDLSYYDHPPMVAYLLYIFAAILGKSAWVVKLMAWSVTLLSQFLFYKLARLLLSEEKSVLALALYTSTLMVSILSLVVTPDVPLILFWTLSLLLLHRAIFLDRKWAWVLAGMAMGLAFDSKYTAVFLPACMGIFLLSSSRYRHLLLTPWPWLTGLVMIATMSPVIYWNVIHDFASFGFQGANRAQIIAEEGWKITHILGSIANQSTVLIPVLFLVLLIGVPRFILRHYREIIHDDKRLFALSFFLPVFGAFMTLSLVYWVKLNWIMPAYVTGVICAVHVIRPSWLRWQFVISIVLHLAAAVQIWGYVFPVKSDDTWYGWDQLAIEVNEVRQDHPHAFLFAGDHYKTTAQLSFYMNEKVYSHNVLGKHAVQFDFVDTDLGHLDGKDALFVDSDPSMRSVPGQSRYPEALDEFFDSVRELPPIEIYKGGRKVRVFRVFLCENYDSSRLEYHQRDVY